MTTTPTRRATNGATHTIGWLPNPAMRAPASTTAASTRCGATFTLATRSPLLDDLTVIDREHLERIEPIDALELADPHVDDAVGRGDQVKAALVRTADLEARARDRLGKAERGLVLVQLVAFGDEHGHRRTGLLGGECQEVVGSSAAGPSTSAGHRRSGRGSRTAPASRRRDASTRDDPLDAQRRGR